jgi:methionine biosynthesis protein MetW
MSVADGLRPDLALIAEWIPAGARVLDLGCGDGALLAFLARSKRVSGYGVELDERYIPQCIRNGVNVIQMDLNRGLAEFDDDSFDCVVLSLALLAMRRSDQVVREMLRVGREGIVSFQNFAHWQVRWQVGVRGHMPLTGALPYEWYNTPNLHFCTFRDFDRLCRELGLEVLARHAMDHRHKTGLWLRLLPNLLGEIALYRFRRRSG